MRDKGQGGEGSGVTSIILRMMGFWNLSAPSCSQQSSSASFPSSWRRSRSRRPEPSSRETISARPRKQTKWKTVQPVCAHTSRDEDETSRLGDRREIIEDEELTGLCWLTSTRSQASSCCKVSSRP